MSVATQSSSTQTESQNKYINAGMVELVDARDLGSCVQQRKGSSPFTGTNAEIAQKRRALAERVEVVGSNPTFRNTRV